MNLKNNKCFFFQNCLMEVSRKGKYARSHQDINRKRPKPVPNFILFGQ